MKKEKINCNLKVTDVQFCNANLIIKGY